MKIKDVEKLTGLSQRSIRLYEEKVCWKSGAMKTTSIGIIAKKMSRGLSLYEFYVILTSQSKKSRILLLGRMSLL